MSRPRLLDLFSGAGGSAVGYYRAGFDVVGVDHVAQPHYPFEFHLANALEWDDFNGFDAIHASPPCQAYSMANRNAGTAHTFPDLIGPVRELLRKTGLPYVIENVQGAPLLNAVKLCGASLGLGTAEMELHRHRYFECSFPITELIPPCSRQKRLSIGVYGNGTPQWHRKKLGRNVLADEWREAMGIPWMVKSELSQAIPPAYTELIGLQLRQHLDYAKRRSHNDLQGAKL